MYYLYQYLKSIAIGINLGNFTITDKKNVLLPLKFAGFLFRKIKNAAKMYVFQDNLHLNVIYSLDFPLHF